MSQFDIGGILALSNNTVQHFIDEFGEDVLVPILEGDRYPKFIELTQPHFVSFALFALRGGQSEFTWGLVRDVIKALYLFLIEGRRYNAVIYQVSTLRVLGIPKANGRLDTLPESMVEVS